MVDKEVMENNIKLIIPVDGGIEIIDINTGEIEYFSFEEATF